MNYNIIATGSSGNAVLLDGFILIDIGISYRKLEPYVNQIAVVMLTHRHGDHLNKGTLRQLLDNRPTIRVACPLHLLEDVMDLNIKNLDPIVSGKMYDYKAFEIEAVDLFHNVPNVGYKLKIGKERALYATDTNRLDHIDAKGYDYYFLEANWDEDKIEEIIAYKELEGEFAHERQSMENHMSLQKTMDYICSNAGNNSQYVLLHQSKSSM